MSPIAVPNRDSNAGVLFAALFSASFSAAMKLTTRPLSESLPYSFMTCCIAAARFSGDSWYSSARTLSMNLGLAPSGIAARAAATASTGLGAN